ncbi:hypothetical protein QR680_007454 [Steinernema hermaphroditum]|uniref:Uncharacterized protein n=1 Tax=Steinernema hermaphroditum TaxID=289476 RepID=A0AA39M6F2_9BILA|nr:hypothetical protein QR680_007454 [Steinernema hermaphroditum]
MVFLETIWPTILEGHTQQEGCTGCGLELQFWRGLKFFRQSSNLAEEEKKRADLGHGGGGGSPSIRERHRVWPEIMYKEQVNAGVELPDTGLHSDLEKMNNTRRDSTIETRWRAYEGIPDGSGSLGMWKKQVREIQSALNPIRRFGSGPFPDPHYGDMEPNPLP